MRGWQKVFKSSSEYRTEIVKAILEDHGMRPIKLNNTISGYGLGDFEILVSPDEVIPSLKLINDEIHFE